MPKMDILDVKGNVVGDVELSERVFGIEPNEPVVHEVVVALLANKRQGTKGTLTRSGSEAAAESLGDKKERAAPVPAQAVLRYGLAAA